MSSVPHLDPSFRAYDIDQFSLLKVSPGSVGHWPRNIGTGQQLGWLGIAKTLNC